MKKITVAYWHSPIKGMKFKHMEQFDYSTRKRNSIIDYVLEYQCSVMIRPHTNGDTGEKGILIWIDNGRFGQR